MTNRLFEMGRDGFLDGSFAWGTGTFSAALISPSTLTDTGIKAVTGATNATPIQLTITANGWAVGDIIYVNGVGGNLAANGLWKVGAQATNTVDLQRLDGVNTTGSAAYTSGGYAVNLGQDGATYSDNWDDFDGALIGGASGKVNLASYTMVGGVADAADTTFTAISGSQVDAVIILKDTGTASTSRVVALVTGKHIVTCNTALAAGTTLLVEPLVAGIPNGTVLTFSSGQTATLTALANAGDRSLTVSSTTISAAAVALAPATGSGLPVTPNGGNIIIAWDNGANKIFKL